MVERTEIRVPDIEPARRGRGRPPKGARESILAAAMELIGEQGLARLTTREVARRAGTSEASVFYHYRDKVGLLQAVIQTGLEPLKAFDREVLAGRAGRPLADTLLQIATGLESFFDRALPTMEAVQADTALRTEFADRLIEQNLGPHRGVRFLSDHLTGMIDAGTVRAGVDTPAAALLLVGACFLRSWLRHLTGEDPDQTLPTLHDTARALAELLTPTDTS